MKVYVRVKALGKRRSIVESVEIEIADGIKTSNELISDIVKQNVKAFNEKKTDVPLFSFLTDEKINELAHVGRVSFQDKKNSNIQDENAAIENALQSYEDGIFKLLINEIEIGYNSEIDLKDGDTLVFIRLTMLAGRLW